MENRSVSNFTSLGRKNVKNFTDVQNTVKLTVNRKCMQLTSNFIQSGYYQHISTFISHVGSNFLNFLINCLSSHLGAQRDYLIRCLFRFIQPNAIYQIFIDRSQNILYTNKNYMWIRAKISKTVATHHFVAIQREFDSKRDSTINFHRNQSVRLFSNFSPTMNRLSASQPDLLSSTSNYCPFANELVDNNVHPSTLVLRFV